MTALGSSPAKPIVNLGAMRLADGDIDGAEVAFREAIEVDPENATAHGNLGYVLALTERHEEALEESERAIALDPQPSGPWAHRGMSQVALGQVNDGLSSLSRAVRLDPENYHAWNAMGRIYLALGRAQDAELAWASGVAARPDEVDLLVSLAVSLGAQDRLGEAISVLHRATTAEPASARAWAQLGVVSMANHDYGTASEALLNALELDSGNAEARFHLAMLRIVVGAHDEAITILTELAAEDSAFSDEARDLVDRLVDDE